MSQMKTDRQGLVIVFWRCVCIDSVQVEHKKSYVLLSRASGVIGVKSRGPRAKKTEGPPPKLPASQSLDASSPALGPCHHDADPHGLAAHLGQPDVGPDASDGTEYSSDSEYSSTDDTDTPPTPAPQPVLQVPIVKGRRGAARRSAWKKLRPALRRSHMQSMPDNVTHLHSDACAKQAALQLRCNSLEGDCPDCQNPTSPTESISVVVVLWDAPLRVNVTRRYCAVCKVGGPCSMPPLQIVASLSLPQSSYANYCAAR